MDAQRLLRGERIYLDFFQFTPPGTDLIYLGAFHLFGPRLWVPNLIVLVLGSALCWVCFRIARQILPQAQAFFAASLFLVALYGKLLNATHHWFSELAVLSAVSLLMTRTSAARIVSAGALLGIATFFTQTRGPIAAVAFLLFFAWNRYRTQTSWRSCFQQVGLLIAPLLITWLALSSYFIVTLGWRELWYWQITYTLRHQVTGAHSLGLPSPLAWRNLPANIPYLLVYLSLPFAYGFSLWLAWRERSELPRPEEAPRMLLTLTGLVTALEIAQSPSWLRVYCVAAPAILLLAWVLHHTGRWQRSLRGVLWIIVLFLMFHQIRMQRRFLHSRVHTPAGTTVTFETMAEKLNWIGQHTQPGDFFFQAPWPGVYLPLQLKNPIFADSFEANDFTRPEFVTDGIRQLNQKRVEYILWPPRLEQPESPETSAQYHLGPFVDFLHEHYQRVATFPDQDEIWQLKSTAEVPTSQR